MVEDDEPDDDEDDVLNEEQVGQGFRFPVWIGLPDIMVATRVSRGPFGGCGANRNALADRQGLEFLACLSGPP